ncbi:hypothetical protein [Micromonospora sp. NPDC093243]|uniref:hypothetical protein n=1 Tax=Micromonospora sp. NPDC093243 TaxID=3364290 RepID=UPI0037F8B55A
MANEVTVPLLPCASIDDMVDFYEVLGLRTTYRQRMPNRTWQCSAKTCISPIEMYSGHVQAKQDQLGTLGVCCSNCAP